MNCIKQLHWCIGILAIILFAAGCEETLPTYVEPEYAFSAEIIVDDPLEFLVEGSRVNPFAIDIWNLTDTLNKTSQFVLEPPFEITVSITIALTAQPSRNKLVSEKIMFDADDDHMGSGEKIRIYIAFPAEDSDGHSWNYENFAVYEFGLTFAGTITIESPDQVPAINLEMHPPARRITLQYVPPEP